MERNVLIDGPDKAEATYLFAHGAGAPMDSGFMTTVAEGLAENGVRVVRFEFPYMEQRRSTGKKRPPDRQPLLIERFTEEIDHICKSSTSLFIGGKSMGGRMATMLAANTQFASSRRLAGCVCFGYPFHAPGKPMGDRADHFTDLSKPLLICQGTRDPFGGYEEFSKSNFPDTVKFEWLEDGDHDLKPRKASGRNHNQNLDQAIKAAATMMLNG